MHTLMSFVGCVGTHMAESELYEIMESTFVTMHAFDRQTGGQNSHR